MNKNPIRIPKTVDMCMQCLNDYEHGSYNDGFCSDICLKQFNKELAKFEDNDSEDNEFDDDSEEEE